MMGINTDAFQPFERTRRLFKMLGKEFHFQFIPSIHFQEILRHVLELLTAVDGTTSAETLLSHPEKAQRLLGPMRRILEEKVYDILFDILLHQNGERIALDVLKHQTSPLEIASFVHLLLTDEEVVRALGVVADGLGKLMEGLLQTETDNTTQAQGH
jgi:hypothetical protein